MCATKIFEEQNKYEPLAGRLDVLNASSKIGLEKTKRLSEEKRLFRTGDMS